MFIYFIFIVGQINMHAKYNFLGILSGVSMSYWCQYIFNKLFIDTVAMI